MRTDGEPADFFYQLDDPASLPERPRLRSRLEHVPENAVGRPGLERLYEEMTEEFCRRARIAWTRSRLTAEDDVDRVRQAVRHVIRLECGQRPRAAAMQPDAGHPHTAAPSMSAWAQSPIIHAPSSDCPASSAANRKTAGSGLRSPAPSETTHPATSRSRPVCPSFRSCCATVPLVTTNGVHPAARARRSARATASSGTSSQTRPPRNSARI